MATVTGGPAFPISNETTVAAEGMTLRDYFAAQAMAGFSANVQGEHWAYEAAKSAYHFADAMLKAREEQAPRFSHVYCSQCGYGFGPGDSGFSSCSDHAGMKGGRQ